MGVMIRRVLLLSAILALGGCSSYHRALSPSNPPSAIDDASFLSDNQALVSDEISAISNNSEQIDTDLPDISPAALNGEAPLTHAKKTQSLLDEALECCQTSQNCWQKGELDTALDSLDQAYALILKVDTEDDPKLIQQKEDLRITISKRIQEIYASRNIVVNGNHNEIPMDLNEHVLKEIKSFQGREKSFFMASYQRSGQYRDRIVKALEENGLPAELSWLPLIESGFKVQALSSARALGLWQFIPSTGYKFGLKRDTYIDERMDPEKATDAAIAYLTELHNIFGDWMTVLAAYNCGEGRVLRVIRNQNVNYLDNFWDLYQLLPLETARYVPRFLATLHILNDPEKYGFELPEPESPLEYEKVPVNRQVDLAAISKNLDIPEKALKSLNPELRYNLLPAEPYTLRIPPGQKEQLLASIDEIVLSTLPQSASTTRHMVRSGETLSTIAARYHTSVSKIMQANNLKKSNYIVIGQTLKIPLGRSYAASTPAAVATASTAIPEIHVVKRGDSLWIIAKKYSTTTQRIQAMNGLTSTALSIGQKLKISEPAPAKAEKSTILAKNLHTYVVQQGDSPFAIAKQFNTSLDRLLQLNRLSKGSTIYPGQTLYFD